MKLSWSEPEIALARLALLSKPPAILLLMFSGSIFRRTREDARLASLAACEIVSYMHGIALHLCCTGAASYAVMHCLPWLCLICSFHAKRKVHLHRQYQEQTMVTCILVLRWLLGRQLHR